MKFINKLHWNNNGNSKQSYNCKIKNELSPQEINVTLIILYIKLIFQLKKMTRMKKHM